MLRRVAKPCFSVRSQALWLGFVQPPLLRESSALIFFPVAQSTRALFCWSNSRSFPLSVSSLNVATFNRSLSTVKPEASKKPSLDERQTKGGKLKQLVQHYGKLALVTHFGLSLVSFGSIYLLLRAGIDLTHFLSVLNLDASTTDVSAEAGTFVLAYAIYKVIMPLRLGVTAAAVPVVARIVGHSSK